MSYGGPAYGLVRTRLGYLLLGGEGLRALSLGGVDDARRAALARVPRPFLPLLLERMVPGPFTYVNVGHSHLSRWNLRALPANARAVIMLHDVIPLDHPDWQREGQPERFAKRFEAATERADVIVTPSHHSAERIRAQSSLQLDVEVVPLGVTTPEVSGDVPEGEYCVAIGTFEPRKNLTFLIDLWEELGESNPLDLHIFGSLGWSYGPFLARYEMSPLKEKRIFLHFSEPDQIVSRYLAGARAFLFPSHVEGFGLPPMEAAALGVPVICAPLPSVREVLGESIIYAETDTLYQWRHELQNLAAKRINEQSVPPLPTWEAHFNTVLKLL